MGDEGVELPEVEKDGRESERERSLVLISRATEDGRDDFFESIAACLRTETTSSRTLREWKSNRTSAAPWTCTYDQLSSGEVRGREGTHLDSETKDPESERLARRHVVDVDERYLELDVRSDEALAPEAQEALRDDKGSPCWQCTNQFDTCSDCDVDSCQYLTAVRCQDGTYGRDRQVDLREQTSSRTEQADSCPLRLHLAPPCRLYEPPSQARGWAWLLSRSGGLDNRRWLA
jgi:hypothetical protein